MPTIGDWLPELERTRRFAADHIPWYRSNAAYGKPILRVEDVRRWPLVRPEDFRQTPWEFSSSQDWPKYITFSSGTSGKVGRPRWHSHAESIAYDEYLATMPGRRGELITLDIHPFDQGPAMPSLNEKGVLYVPLLNPWHYELILQLLRDGWCHRGGRHRIELLHAFSPGLRVLTGWLAQRQIDPRDFGVRILTGYGSIQPELWRRRIERDWNARYIDQFGLSEVKMSAAVECTLCGGHHFHRPIVAEVLDAESGRPRSEGIGVLVLSELFPLAQEQILLRYWTGDLVEFREPCVLSSLGFTPRGRVEHSVFGPEEGMVVGALQVGEICAEFPEVATTPIPWAGWATDAGGPRFALKSRGSGAEVIVELRFDPDVFTDRAQDACSRIRERLEAEITGLSALVGKGRFKLTVAVRGPGKLSDPTPV